MSEIKFTEGDPDKDFFEQNPHWRYIDSSQRLLKQFSNLKLISKLRWAAYYIEDPDSKYYRYPKAKRVEVINNNYLKDDYELIFDEIEMKITNEEVKYLFEWYGTETMSKLKRDYYEREMSYQLIVQQERALSGESGKNLKDKAAIQVSIGKIYDELKKAREELDIENEEEKAKARGRQQPGTLFKKN